MTGEDRRALAAGWTIVDPLTGATLETGPCDGSGQRLAFLEDGWSPCPVCGRLSRVTAHELERHEPPIEEEPAHERRQAPGQTSLF